jgi:hypothetical protein
MPREIRTHDSGDGSGRTQHTLCTWRTLRLASTWNSESVFPLERSTAKNKELKSWPTNNKSFLSAVHKFSAPDNSKGEPIYMNSIRVAPISGQRLTVVHISSASEAVHARRLLSVPTPCFQFIAACSTVLHTRFKNSLLSRDLQGEGKNEASYTFSALIFDSRFEHTESLFINYWCPSRWKLSSKSFKNVPNLIFSLFFFHVSFLYLLLVGPFTMPVSLP